MARLFKQGEGIELGLPGRQALEIVSGRCGSRHMTLRRVEIPVPRPGEGPRAAHQHSDFEECIFVLAGQGTTFADSGEFPLEPGDALLMPAGEKHVTRTTGTEPLLLLCFFPVPDITADTHEPGAPAGSSKKS